MMKTYDGIKKHFPRTAVLLGVLTLLFSMPAFAHCDSYDGPLIQDAQSALENENVALVMKWIDPTHEAEISDLFDKTIAQKGKDPEIYSIVEKHFLETLVRLHRETENAPYTGLKPAGSTTPIIVMADASIANSDVNTLLDNLGHHIQAVIAEKHEKVTTLAKVKDNSVSQGRAYVAAYVDYTHTLEAIEAVLAHGGHH